MRRSWASVTVGLLVLVVSTISYFLIRSTSERTTGSKGIAVWGLFRDATGLYEKSRVETAGISIGQIEKRELDQATAKAKVTVRIAPGTKLYENGVISKKSASLLGEYYLEVDPGTPFANVGGEKRAMRELKDGDEVKNIREPIAMGDIMESVGTLMPILHDILEDVRKLTSGTITHIADNINDLIETNSTVLEQLLNHVDAIAANVDSVTSSEAGDVKASIKNVRDITESIKSLIGSTQGQVAGTGNKVQGSIDRLQTTLDNLDKTMHNMELVSERLEKGEGTAGKLLTDDAIANNIEDITSDASSFVRGLTKLQTIVGLRSEYNIMENSVKNYLSVQLMPRPDKFYLIELVQDPRGYTNTTSTVTVGTMKQSYQTTTTTDQLKFSLEFGKRIGPVAGRFGIKESTGGFGGDLYLLDDRLVLSVDVFEFAASDVGLLPRVKAGVAWDIYDRNIFLVAGADDLLNYHRGEAAAGGGFDYFAGLQLSFNDQDLKSLLLFGGGAASSAASK